MTGAVGNTGREVIRSPARSAAQRSSSPASDDLFADDDYSRVLLTSLMRAQLGATLSILLPAGALLSLYPLVAVLVPGLAHAHVFSIPLTLLVLGGGIYPPLVLLGLWYVRKAERVEQRFTDLLKDQ